MLKKGLYAALLTPFEERSDSIDGDALAELIIHDAALGLDGAYVGGSTGEAFLMSEAERTTLLALAAEARPSGFALIAQVGDPNPDLSHRLAREAARLGYDAVSAVAPFYYKYTADEIAVHYRSLASATDLPFLIYNFPALSGISHTVSELAELLDLPNVVGVKNTSPDYFTFERLRARVPGKLLFNGFDETLLCGLVLGADGGIGSTYNLLGADYVRLLDAVRGNRLAEARAIQSQVNGVIDVLIRHGVFPSLKVLMTLRGIPMGRCRQPFAPLSKHAIEDLERVAEALAAPQTIELATAR